MVHGIIPSGAMIRILSENQVDTIAVDNLAPYGARS